ncbi:Protein brambleberry [Halotydeus destructor]|nr:Protein brambleberry [Halotydeus destructor]
MVKVAHLLVLVSLAMSTESGFFDSTDFDSDEQDDIHQQQADSSPIISQSESQLSEGKRSFEIMEGNGKLYGPCWIDAMVTLHADCKHLDEDKHARLALKFANCFLEKTGHETYPCKQRQEVQECLKDMSVSAHNAYTHFFTHTQSTCYYLANQIWQKQTENTIAKLSSTSQKVTKELSNIQNMQEKTMVNQVALNEDILLSRRTMDDFKEELSKKHDLLSDMFTRIDEIKEFILLGSSHFNTFLYYVTACISIYMTTTTTRTKHARFPLIILLIVNICCELKIRPIFHPIT